jgi:hypothetical protein
LIFLKFQRWFLYSPGKSFYSTITGLEFSKSINAAEHEIPDGILECTQNAGDIMFVPALWGHATLNTMQSIGVAHEFSVESFCME